MTPRRPLVTTESPSLRLPAFSLADQFGRELDEMTYEGVPVIVVVGDRKSVV